MDRHDIIKKMLIVITRRRILKELKKLRWDNKKNQLTNYRYTHRGVPLEDFVKELRRKEFTVNNWIRIYSHLRRKKYINNFKPKVRDVIKKCIKIRWIDDSNGVLIVSPEGEDFLSQRYYIIMAGFITALIKEIVKTALGKD